MKARDIPNIITILRIALVLPVVVSLARGEFATALLLFAVAGVSDGIDGFLARHFGWQSRLGALLDPLADKLLLVSVYLTLGVQGGLPLWLVALVILRDGVILSGLTAYHRFCGELEMAPTRLSKANTLFQILLIVTVMLSALGMALPEWLHEALVLVVASTTLLSGADYVWIWSRRAWHCRQGGGSK